MLWYENIKTDYVYSDLSNLLHKNPNLYTDECIIFCINGDTGFGSQLTLLSQYSLYLRKINPKIHCLGHFSNNSSNFKYHDTNYNNSFFLYFRYLKNVNENIKYYFVNTSTIVLSNEQYPFIIPQSIDGLNVDDIEINKQHSNYFKENFELKIGDDIINKINNIKMETSLPLIGIHMRSILQIVAHSYGRDINIVSKLLKIKNTLDMKYTNYNIFFVTDVNNYINIAKTVFTNNTVYYNDFISRIFNDTGEKFSVNNKYCDSVINLEQYCGFKLGSDILYDCLSLINCDYYYVSVTNIAYITSYINKKNNGIHFN
jgi:hypothetical protein